MKQQNISIIISIIAIIISIISLSFSLFVSTNSENNNVWCRNDLPKSSITGEITGEIIEVSKATQSQRANILVKKNDGTGNIIVHHNSNIEFKVGQVVKIEHDGINDSNPPQTAAICIEIIRDNPVSIGEKSKYIISDNLVSLSVKEDSFTNSKATLILENHTDETYIYGASYSIEYEKDGIWYEIIPNKDMIFISIAYSLKSKELKEIPIHWEYYYGKLIPGKYRVIKGVFLESETPIESNDIVYLGAEFIIK